MKDGVAKYNIDTNELQGEEDPNASVSMNYWGFHPSIFEHIEKGLFEFMSVNTDHPTAEYYIPDIVTDMIVTKDDG